MFGTKGGTLLADVLAGRLKLWQDQQGAIAVMTGLLASVLVGFIALGTDVASWQIAQRSMQGAADAAAYSAGIAYSNSDGTSVVTQAKGIAASLGYIDSQNGVTVSVNQPPTSGSHAGIATAIEVIIQEPQPLYFAGPFLSSGPTAKARAIATTASSGVACILALDRTTDQSINQQVDVSGSANIYSPGCDVVANSTSSHAIAMSGSAAITTPCLVASGGVQVTSGLTLKKCTNPTTNAAPTPDPYTSVPAPTKPAAGSCVGSGTITCSPGYYSSGISISGSQSATFQSGTYYVNGNLSISGNSTATGTGVTFFITAGNTVSISGYSTTTFSAPTSGTYSGIVFFGDRSATNGNNSFSGGSNSTITGAIYFPTEGVSFTGGSSSGSNCTQIIADTITITGSAYLNNSCSGDGMTSINVNDGSPGAVQIAE